jgi:hypothetical protein
VDKPRSCDPGPPWVSPIAPAAAGSAPSLGRVDGFGVSTARLQDAARAAAGVAENVPTADLAAVVRAMAEALPGGVTAAGGEALADGWAAAAEAVATAIAGHSVAMALSATDYRAADTAVGGGS